MRQRGGSVEIVYDSVDNACGRQKIKFVMKLPKQKPSPLAPLIKLCAQKRGKKTELLRRLIMRGTTANWGQVNDWLNFDPAKRRNPRAKTLKVLLEIQNEMLLPD